MMRLMSRSQNAQIDLLLVIHTAEMYLHQMIKLALQPVLHP